MASRHLLGLIAAVALAPAAAAQAQVSLPSVNALHSLAPATPAPTPSPTAAPAPAVRPPPPASSGGAGLEVGMSVADQSGAVIGAISQIGHVGTGDQSAIIDIDGVQVIVPLTSLSLSSARSQAVSSKTKDELLASAARPN
jgi:hypothetical protein